MVEHTLLNRALAEFAQTLVRRYEIAEVLDQLVRKIVEAFDVGGAGVLLAVDSGDPHFITAFNDATAAIERAQEQAEEGPCYEAATSGEVIVVHDVTAEAVRWPAVARVAAEVGMGAVAAMPMRFDDRVLGAVNVYAEIPRDWADEEVAALRIFADMAATYVANSADLQQSQVLNRQLQRALESRVVIEQAKGFLVARHGVTVDAAFEGMRRYARSRSLRLAAVAEAVVRGDVDPLGDEPPDRPDA